MRDYQEIMELVEEVRGILGEAPHDWSKPQKKGKLHHSVHKMLMKKQKKHTIHNPFKNIKRGKHLGPAVRKSTKNPGTERDFWACRCSSYRCLCRGKSAEGKEVKKVVHIDRGYKKTYNAKYRKWRKAHQKEFEAGGKRGFKKKAQPHHKHYKKGGSE